MSAMVPAPTTWTDPEAPPLSMRKTVSIVIEGEIAARTLKTIYKENEMRYIVRRPYISLNEDHQSGNIDKLSMYRAIDKLVMVEVV
jgi:hypothetical protein